MVRLMGLPEKPALDIMQIQTVVKEVDAQADSQPVLSTRQDETAGPED